MTNLGRSAAEKTSRDGGKRKEEEEGKPRWFIFGVGDGLRAAGAKNGEGSRETPVNCFWKLRFFVENGEANQYGSGRRQGRERARLGWVGFRAKDRVTRCAGDRALRERSEFTLGYG